jgi:hypothetical protein
LSNGNWKSEKRLLRRGVKNMVGMRVS